MDNIFENSECTVYKSGNIHEGNVTSRLYDLLVNPIWCEETIIKKIRSFDYGTTEQKALKVNLSAATFSSVQKPNVRGEEHHIKHSGFIQFDIDGKDNPEMLTDQGLIEMKSKLISIPYTAYCGLSASGRGLWGLFRIKNPLMHQEHFEAMEKSFKAIGIIIDRKPRNVASLRFICYDQEAYINKKAKIFNLIYVHPQKEKTVTKTSNNTDNNIEGKVLIKKFNTECSFDLINDILLNAGWQFHSTKGERVCYTRPGKDIRAGLSADYHLGKRTFTTFSSSAPGLNWYVENKKSGTWSASPVTLLLNYECKGNWAEVFRYIKTYL